MRVLLIVPVFNYKNQYPSYVSVTDFPVGFAYLAAALRTAGFEVFGINPNNDAGYDNAYQMLRDKIGMAVKNIQPHLVCTGGICTDYAFLKDTFQIVRDLAPHVPIVMGGGIVSNDSAYIFSNLRPDFSIVGEGEEVLVQLATCLENGKNSYDHIPNIGYWEQGTPRFTKQDFNYPDLNGRAFPDYEPFGIVEMLDKYSLAARYLYRYPRVNPRPMTLVAGRSCPFSCTFCVHRRGIKYRVRGIDNIIEEIAVLYEKYKFNILIILDELFTVDKARLKNFSKAILQGRKNFGWDFDWTFQTHASASFDHDSLAIAREAGCFFFAYGLESASPPVLASMRKKTKPSQIIKAIKAADAAHIGFGGNFIFGDVAETPDTLGQTMNFFQQYCRDIHISFGAIQPYPGSRLFDYCLEQGIIGDKLHYYEHIDERCFNMTKMPSIFWSVWIKGLMQLGGYCLWLQAVDALSCRPVAELADNPMVLHYGKQIFEIEAICPFCKNQICYRDFLDKPRVDQTSSLFARIKAKVKYSRWFFHLFALMVQFLPVWRPYKLLYPLMATGNFKGSYVVTGCSYCNKRVKINLENNK